MASSSLASESEDQTCSTVNSSVSKEELNLTWKIKEFQTLFRIAKASQNREGKTISEFFFSGGKSFGNPSNWKFQLELTDTSDSLSLHLHYLGSEVKPEVAIASFETHLRHVDGKYYQVAATKIKHFLKNIKPSHSSNCNISRYGADQGYPCSCALSKAVVEDAEILSEVGWRTQRELEEGGLFQSADADEPEAELSLKLKITLYGKSEGMIAYKLVAKSPNIPSSEWSEVFANTLIANFTKLLDSGEGADVIFSVAQEDKDKDSEKIKAHRSILGAQSPVFLAMFQSEMKERSEGEVEILDISPQGMKILLKFLYTGVLADSWGQVATDLIYASEKYQLDGLKKFLDENIEPILTPLNVREIYHMAESHGLKVAMKSVQKYHKQNADGCFDALFS